MVMVVRALAASLRRAALEDPALPLPDDATRAAVVEFLDPEQVTIRRIIQRRSIFTSAWLTVRTSILDAPLEKSLILAWLAVVESPVRLSPRSNPREVPSTPRTAPRESSSVYTGELILRCPLDRAAGSIS